MTESKSISRAKRHNRAASRPAPPADGYPLAILIWMALGAVLLPLLLLGAYGFNRWVANQQEADLARVSGYSANLAHNVDRELRGFQETVEVLAGSRHLQWGDIQTFDELARDAAAKTAGGQFVLTDRSLQQLVNTQAKSGEPLPKTADSEAVRRVFETGKPLISDLRRGALARYLHFTVHVPVQVNGEIRYVLSYAPRSGAIPAVLEQTVRPPGWFASIIDGSGLTIARSHGRDELFGKPEAQDFLAQLAGADGVINGIDRDGLASVISYHGSNINGWKSIVWAPKMLLETPMREATWAVASLLALALAASILTAWLMARAISGPVRQLVSSASALGRGEPADARPTAIREANIIGQALHDASGSISAREAEIRESEARFRNMADHAPVMIWVTEADGQCTFLSQSWYDFTGQTPETGLGLGWLNAVHHDDRAYSEKVFLDANAKHEPFSLEYRFRRKDGAYRWAIDSARPRLSSNGEFLGYIGSVIDISDRKTAEEAANEARRFTENLMNTAPASIYIFNCETKRTELSNAYAGEMLGYDPEAWQHMTMRLHELMHPDDAARIDSHFDKLSADGSGRPAEFEYRMRHANGSWRWFLSRDVVYERKADGRLLRILGTAVDITERKWAEEALAKTRASLEIALDAAGAAPWEYNVQTGQVEWSPQLYSQLGVNPAESPASLETFLAHVHPDDRAGLQTVREQERMAEPGSRFTVQLRQRGPANETRWIERRSYVGLDEPGGRRIFGLNIDVTEREKSEEALRESEERFKLAINASRALIYYVDLRNGSKAITFGLENLTGYRDDSAELTSEWWYSLMHPEDLPKHLAILKRHLRSGGRYESEYRIRHSDGHWIWIQDDGEITLGPDGPMRIAGTNSDITERKQREEQIRLLMREVNHRSKNMLAVIQVIARQTAASGSKDFIKRFGERVQSLAVTQDQLVKNEWLGVDLEELIGSQLMQFKGLIGSRITLKGKSLRISAASAQNLGLAIHELASNAGKYGALTNSKGRVEVAWQIKKAKTKEEEASFVISWTERDGPPAVLPERRGFGTTVIGSMVKMGLSANVELVYAKRGLEWRLDCPAGNVLETHRMQSPRPADPVGE